MKTICKNNCKTLDKLSATYENHILLGDFNTEPEEKSIAELFYLYNLINLVQQNTSFQNTDTLETGLSDSYKATFTVPKQHFPKQKPKVVIH